VDREGAGAVQAKVADAPQSGGRSWRGPKLHVLIVVRPCVAAAKPEQPEPGTPAPMLEPSVEGRSQTNLFFLCSNQSATAPVLHPSSPSASTPPRHRILGPEVSTVFPSSLWSLAFVPRREKRAKPVVSLVLFLDRCPAPRRRADPPSLESQPSSRASRFAGAADVVAARAPLPCSGVVPCFDESRRASVCRRHPHAERATVEPRPCLSLAMSRVSTNPCRALVVGVVPSPWLCRRHFAHTHHHRAEALFFLAEPVHAHSRTREVVRRRMPRNQRRLAVPRRFLFLRSLA
jgi:hypothetical protein